MILLDATQVEMIMTLDNVPFAISGLSDDSDCIKFPDAAELANFKKGATGKMIAFSTGERGGPVSISVLANSTFVDAMNAHILIKRLGSSTPVHLVVTNTTVGDYYTCTEGVLTKAPIGSTYGKGEVASMKYEFEFQDINYTPATSKRDSVLKSITGLGG